MDYTKIIVVTGKSGLFKVLSQTRTGVIAESLLDGKKMPISANNKITTLEDIVIFTTGEDMKLIDVLKKISEFTQGQKAIAHKSSDNDLRTYFESIIPEYDKERVYISDIRKMISWFNILQTNQMLEFEDNTETKNEASDNDKNIPEKQVEEKVSPDSE